MDKVLLDSIRQQFAANVDLWQYRPLSANDLHKFANEKGLSFFDATHITKLWRVGLLRADYAIGSPKCTPNSFVPTAQGKDRVFVDNRSVPHRTTGYGNSFAIVDEELGGLEPYFHPFKPYVLHHIKRVFSTKVSATQYLSYALGIEKVVDSDRKHLDEWTATTSCSDRFNYWNQVAELAAVLEPAFYRQVFNQMRWGHPFSEASMIDALDNWKEATKPLPIDLGFLGVREILRELGQAAETIDGNRNVHVLLRLMAADQRLKLQGNLGLAMHFLSMAEVIRRAGEYSLQQILPEEDEIGWGQWFSGARKMLYGTERIFDAPRTALRDYLVSMGIDYGTKVRCYVEGDTEAAGLAFAMQGVGGIEIINLRGQVLEKSGKGLAFIDALENDQKSHVFSVVVIDGDREDFVRALKKAVRDGRMFGRFFIQTPDIEYANFSTPELLRIAQRIYSSIEVGEQAIDSIQCLSGEAFVKAVRNYFGVGLKKDAFWGEALMAFALENPQFPPEHPKAGKDRPLLDIVGLLFRAQRSGYLRSVSAAKLDPETGELIDTRQDKQD